MASVKNAYQCQECQAVYPKWIGKCEACGLWNSIALLDTPSSEGIRTQHKTQGRALDVVPLQEQGHQGSTARPVQRLLSGMTEFDRVIGGGVMPGSLTLVGGDPGIGKSTLLLQIAARLSQNQNCCYVSAEEDICQIRMRAQRLHVGHMPLNLLASNHIGDILTTLQNLPHVRVVVIDSIQTVYSDLADASPGTVTQVRTCAQELMRIAKTKNISVIMVSHVTKEGVIAGPKTLEHMVDTVLYFEGEKSHSYRMLRTVKNRFGPTDEMGVFLMEEQGLTEVANPSSLFLSQRAKHVPGTLIYAGVEGTQPLLVEIQALLAPTTVFPPRRHVVGWDAHRLGMMVAILETHCGLPLGQRDVYLNIVGGLKLHDPGVDLAVCSAIFSCFFQRNLPEDGIFFGEIGLVGEIRPVGQIQARLKEAFKLGFRQAYLPPLPPKTGTLPDMTYHHFTSIQDVWRWFQGSAHQNRTPDKRPAYEIVS